MKLSIITVNLNNKSGLQKTIDSVISQTYKDFEWIIIDGGSTDGSKELIEKYSSYITYWVSEPDKGIYNAMNKGIKVAKGEYCLFLNSGDGLVSSDVLKKVFQRNISTDIINGNLIILSNPIRRDYGIHSDYISGYDLIKGNLNHPSTFIRKSLFEQYGLYDESLKIVSDWKFFFYTIVIKGCSVKYINEDIAFFNTNGISNTSLKKVKEERIKVLSDLCPSHIIEDYTFTIHKNEICKHYFSRILYALLYKTVCFYEKIIFNNEKSIGHHSTL